MAVASKSKEKQQISPDVAVAGVLALLVDAREARVREDKSAVKTEVLLSNAGLSITDIAALLGKNYDAVKVTLQRAKK
jgi:DNA-directed RNA polymerase specialized sigma24 family protein